MMEAAIVLPIVILVVITSILIIMFFFSEMTERSRLHVALRNQAGAMTERTVYCGDVAAVEVYGAEMYEERKIGVKRVCGKKYLIMEHKGVLAKKGAFTVEGSCYITNGPNHVRRYNLLKAPAAFSVGDGGRLPSGDSGDPS